jgi:hypothetical protein
LFCAQNLRNLCIEWPQKAYDSMTELITWLGFNPEIMLDGVDFVQEEIAQSFNIDGQT